jgi:hypothetical protein
MLAAFRLGGASSDAWAWIAPGAAAAFSVVGRATRASTCSHHRRHRLSSA